MTSKSYSQAKHNALSFTYVVPGNGRHSSTGRRLVAIDVENLSGGPLTTLAAATELRDEVSSALQLRAGDLVIVGASHVAAVPAGVAWGNCRLVVQSGEDGADLALLRVLNEEGVATRFSEVLLVSGDGIFTETVARLASADVRVTVVSRPESCSRRLRMAASETKFLSSLESPVGSAA